MTPSNRLALSLATTLAYHERTKHFPGRYARALGAMDWATQPDPFRRFAGAPLLPLDLVATTDQPRYEAAFSPGRIAPEPIGRRSMSQLLQDSMALSAWKQAGSTRWSLRINPSSGNLHPTESYLVAGPIAGVAATPAVYHYAPHEHALERRAELSEKTWNAIASQLPAGSVLLGLTSIHWREAWKYGERAFRYCQHDVGHAIGAVAVAAAGLGWETRLLEGVADQDLARLLGIVSQSGVEAEHADCLIAVFPQVEGFPVAFPVERQRAFALAAPTLDEIDGSAWHGTPSPLSPDHHDWPVIDEVAQVTRKTEPPPDGFWHRPAAPAAVSVPMMAAHESSLGLRSIIYQRRSAVALDGHSGIVRDALFQILSKTLRQNVLGQSQVPFTVLPWRPCIDLLLFIHRVEGLLPGLYLLLRDPARQDVLRRSLTPGFAWSTPEGCPASLPLFLLEAGDARRVAEQTSCGQEIAAGGVFAAAMLGHYRAPIEAFGPWFYRRLHWEAGVVGQQLYLEAEASGIRATGIGCYFDDMTHRTFGIAGDQFQVLYHFTMGAPVDDPRIQTVPPYLHLHLHQKDR
jgi:SagB-type dehydrogenase family enzyme